MNFININPVAFYTTMTWLIVTLLTLGSCIARVLQLSQYERDSGMPDSAITVLNYLGSFLGWGSINRISTCLFFLLYGFSRLLLITPSESVEFSFLIGAAVILVNVFTIYSNMTDRKRYSDMKKHITQQYASDVAHGISDAMNRIRSEE